MPRSLFSLTAAAASAAPEVLIAHQRVMPPLRHRDATARGCAAAFAPPTGWLVRRQSVHLGFP